MAARAKQTRQHKAGTANAKAVAEPPALRGKRSKRAASSPVNGEQRQLEAELAAARARIAELEKLNEEAVNRIDWIIDSLQTVLSEKA